MLTKYDAQALIGGNHEVTPMYEVTSYPSNSWRLSATLFAIKGALDGLVIRAARKMGQSVGDGIGSAWITVIGMVAAAGICAMVAFAIKSSVDIGDLETKQIYIQQDLKDIKRDMRFLRNNKETPYEQRGDYPN